ncbi:chitosanase [Acanthocystis turfacea Chlorella virus Canal-1]|nr:chitosanase [Acanthocystis turfacea Chlorella virus Canal-1]
MSITNENKKVIMAGYAQQVLTLAETTLGVFGKKYSGLGPNRRTQFKTAFATALAAGAPTGRLPSAPAGEITAANKKTIILDYVNQMLILAEDRLNAVGKKYSGLGPNRRIQFKQAAATAIVKGVPAGPSAGAATIPVIPTHVQGSAHMPADAAPKLAALGFADMQADTILSLISLPENSTTEWWTNYNYAERLGDGRGWTVTLYGACSGTGDLLMILKDLQNINPNHELLKYIPAMEKTKGDNVNGLEKLGKDIESLGDDKDWQQAVWDIYIKLYWNFARNFADKLINRPGAKLTSPLTRGYIVDVALNHGANLESFGPILKGMKNKDEQDEAKWFLDFVEARRKLLKRGFEDLDTSKTGDRCTLWANIFKEGNTSLARPIECFKGYWGDAVIR